MEELKYLLEECLGIDLIRLVISNAKNKEDGEKVKVRPILLKDTLYFQSSFYKQNKVYHKNYEKQELIEQVLLYLQTNFRQMELSTKQIQANVLVSKKGKLTIKKKRNAVPVEKIEYSHNRKKRYLLEEGIPVPFLIDLGVMNESGKILNAKYDKFRQINRFLEFVEDIVPTLPRGREITIIDFGCGKSYLTFAVYYYLRVLRGFDIRVIGLDLKEDVIYKCNSLREKYRYDKLDFYIGDIASYEGVEAVDMVITLHACDTATDFALAKAVKWGAGVILSVPCCQHELNGQIENKVLEPVLRYGLIKERMAALITDAFRAELLEREGYEAQILEFIDMEHTPKNILIRALKKQVNEKKTDTQALTECMDFLQAAPTLDKLLREDAKRCCK